MTVFNISLCLPALDIAALVQKRSIAVVTQRFVLPEKSFALLPCCELPAGASANDWYRSDALITNAPADSTEITYWARCAFCQQIDESTIAKIAAQTIWTETALLDLWRERNTLFLSILRVHKLPQSISPNSAPASQQLYKFVPLAQYLEADIKSSILSDREFETAKTAFLEPSSSQSEDSQPEQTSPIETTTDDVFSSSDWVLQISRVGNSSDGHTFEKLVRKALLELGFSNSQDKPEASLDPEATGGAGGLDFYADWPYAIVGECKATTTKKVKDDPATQLHKLGLKHLERREYENSLKLIIAAGKITSHANKIAVGHQMNVLRPETLQSLVELKLKYDDILELSDLEFCLKRPPFGVEADDQMTLIIQQYETDVKRKAQYMQQRVQIIQTVKELSEQTIHSGKNAFIAMEIRAHHNAKYQPLVTDTAVAEMLKELSSPMAGYLSRKQLPGDQQRFGFIKDMPSLHHALSA